MKLTPTGIERFETCIPRSSMTCCVRGALRNFTLPPRINAAPARPPHRRARSWTVEAASDETADGPR